MTFEEALPIINQEINKRKVKWTLSSITYLDFDDVRSIILVHLHKKWDKYDQSKPLAPWVNRIITRQIINLVRNVYGNYSRPCLSCPAAEPDGLCRLYVKQCADCPIYAVWAKTKKPASDIKLALPLVNHEQEVFSMTNDSLDIERSAQNIHKHMKTILKPHEWRVYTYLYIENKTEKEVAALMDYTTSEKSRQAGYRQIFNIKESILKKVKKCLYGDDVDLVY